MKLGIVLFTFLFGVQLLGAQEFQCRVQVVSPSVQGTNKSVFETLQKDLTEFMNNQKWTEDVFAVDERIDFNILINITEVVSVDDFKATIQVQARRPVYNSAYYSVLLNHLDQDFQFRYVESEPIIYNPNAFDSNLVGVLAYYAYVVLGLDYDTFALNGGSPHYKNAEKIVAMAQSSPYVGWKSYENQRNRYWLIDQVLDTDHKPLRQCYYEYHRKGLDVMAENVETGRAQILRSLEGLRKVFKAEPGSFYMQIFFNSKADEIVKIFEESFSMEQGKAVELLKEIDPANQKKYEGITSSK